MLSPVCWIPYRSTWRQHKPKEWLFPGDNPGQPISGNDIFMVFHNAVRRAGHYKKVSRIPSPQFCNTPAGVRHRSRTIQILSGHRSLKTRPATSTVSQHQLRANAPVLLDSFEL